MNAIELLVKEHALIDEIFPVLEEAAWRLDHGRRLEKDVFPGILDFLNTFVSDCHFAREEEVLIPALAARGVDITAGIAAEVLADHGKSRLIFKKLTELGRQLDLAETAAEIGASVRIYDSLMRVHKKKEDEHLFPMAVEVLSAGEMDELTARYAEMDATQEPFKGSIERFSRLASELQERLEIE